MGSGVGEGGRGVAVGPTGVAVLVGVTVTTLVGVFVGGFPAASAGEAATAITMQIPKKMTRMGSIRFISNYILLWNRNDCDFHHYMDMSGYT